MLKKITIASMFLATMFVANAQEKSSSSGSSSSDIQRRHNIKVNLPSLLFNVAGGVLAGALPADTKFGMFSIAAAYEYRLNKRMTLGSWFSYYGFSISNNNITTGTDVKLSAAYIGIEPEFRYYVGKKGAPRGFFVGGYMPIGSFGVGVEGTSSQPYQGGTLKGSANADISAFIFGLGATIGAQWLIGNRVGIELLTGFGYSVGKLSDGKATVAGNVTGGTADGQTVNETYTFKDVAGSDVPVSFGGAGVRLGFNISYAFGK
jgi:hypothetical protein